MNAMSDAPAIRLHPLLRVIDEMRRRFLDLLVQHTAQGMTREMYRRYLSMQYHLTRDVQRYFLTAAASSRFARMRKLRRFLVDFANEEELHYLVALSDLQALGCEPAGLPFDVELWHAYFTGIVRERPFVRLGAAAVLENLSDASTRPHIRRVLAADFLDAHNTKFIVLHMHETLPHGLQMLGALAAEELGAQDIADLVEGAQKGGVLYLRMAEWALDARALAHVADHDAAADLVERELEGFSMAEVQTVH